MKTLFALFSGLLGAGTALAGATHPAAHHASLSSQFMSTLPMMLGIVLIFYFMLIRPQSKRNKEQRNLLDGLTAGDEIVTTGGIVAKIKALEDDLVQLRVTEDQVLLLQKSSIASVLPKGTWKSLQSN